MGCKEACILIWQSVGNGRTAVCHEINKFNTTTALGSAALLLLGRVRPEKIYWQIDWSFMMMFCGLFVVEDCPVCCRANTIHVQVDDEGNAQVWAEPEQDYE